jgi:hypothetical protein
LISFKELKESGEFQVTDMLPHSFAGKGIWLNKSSEMESIIKKIN